MKHTSEPWYAKFRFSPRSFSIVDSNGESIAFGPTGSPTARDRANATLIAAAPDLLTQLSALVNICQIEIEAALEHDTELKDRLMSVVATADEVIRKAKGA